MQWRLVWKRLYLSEVVLASLNGKFDFFSSDLGANLLQEAVSGLLNGLPQLQVLWVLKISQLMFLISLKFIRVFDRTHFFLYFFSKELAFKSVNWVGIWGVWKQQQFETLVSTFDFWVVSKLMSFWFTRSFLSMA